MAANQGTLLSLDDFARYARLDPQELLRQLIDGDRAGQYIEDTWFIDTNTLEQGDEVPSTVSAATLLMLAAANIHWRELFDDFNARRSIPLKASTPEFALDIALIEGEVMMAKRRAFWFEVIMGIAGIFGMVNLWIIFVDGRNDYAALEETGGASSAVIKVFLAWLVITVSDFIYQRKALARARQLLGRPASEAVQQSSRNVTIYGGYTPFVGSGFDAGGWSFTVNLLAPDHAGGVIEPVTARDLYNETCDALQALSIPVMTVKDEVFVDGRDVRAVGVLLPNGPFGLPAERVSKEVMEASIGANDNVMRHYKVIRLPLWSGLIALSTLFRYVIVADTLYVEAKTHILLPIKEKFLNLQNLPLVSLPWELLNYLLNSGARAIVVWIPVVFRAITFIFGGFMHTHGKILKLNIKEIEKNQKYNYGWSKSLRETWAGESFSRYFQVSDQDFYRKMVREILLETLLKSLERRHICTESLKSASTKIYNEGVIINGGAVNAENIAAGKGAQATVKNIVRGAQSGTRGE